MNFIYQVETNTGSAYGTIEAESQDEAESLLREQYTSTHPTADQGVADSARDISVEVESIILQEVNNG